MRKIILLFLIFPIVGHCDVYKCVNGGKVIYATSPCGANAAQLDTDNVSVMAPSSLVVNYSNMLGAYVVPAKLNGVLTSGTLDTGATSTTINGSLAARAGIVSCVPVGVTATAAGNVTNCRAVVDRIEFGGFVFRAISVSVIPSMTQEMLIGQDVLSQLQVTQRSGVMTLAK